MPVGQEGAVPFRDAEAWLAERGMERDPITISLDPTPSDPPEPSTGRPAGQPLGGQAADQPPAGASGAGPQVSSRDAGRVAQQAAADAQLREADAAVLPDPAARRLEDDVASAVAFLRRSTSVAPQAEGRLRAKLEGRGIPAVVIEQAIERALAERLIDDEAMAAALVAEGRAKGHAVARIRRDLRDRGFTDATLARALGGADQQDPESAAFAVARDKAERLTGLAADTAFRRVVGHVVRRGYSEGLARKVAREAVFTARDADRTTGH